MFELFKQRNFSENISDTIAFFKTFGKHYFKNYFIINGVLLMILMVLVYFISKVYMEFLTSITQGINPNPDYFGNYFTENIGIFIGGFILFLFITILLSVINIAYPIIYLDFIEKRNDTSFTHTDIINEIKKNFGRIFLFILGLIFIVTPLLLIAFAISAVLCIVLIGIPILFILIFATTSFIALSFQEYMVKKIGFFEALGVGYNLVKQNFWTTVGTTFVMAFLIQTIQGIITMVPYIIGMILIFTSSQNVAENDPSQAMGTFSILFTVIMVASILLSYVFHNFQMITQGLIYYSLREENEENNSKSQIDLIGTDSE
ncbi:hypothetical protein [Flavobacterium sp.]|uniref:hypothetical protein n=1 Tax=Flavobacterium sp. TaxID=239 RepID=UPI00286CEF30|nr:hypothetical protein [Flavobacterium sp.]